ncbi:ABC transporter permease [Schaalia sp. ZJ1691]|uniref:ABC transporter permease n=1 Tax=Schaalia sp. ZJ1691 TaxID=2709404 RepID=UPI0013EA9D98|nr:ABC transporter permease [Schaalia sp. ZJ1691]
MHARYVLSRLLQFIGVLLVLSFLIFSLLYLVPGDLVKILVGNRQVTPEVRQAITAQYHLDDPFIVQYVDWLGRALHADFGTSIRSGTPVTQVIGQRLPLTLELTFLAFVIALGVGIPLGLLAARKIDSRVDRAIVGWAVVGISAPGFALGMVLLYVFAVMLGWFPTYGTGGSFLDTLWHLTLPAIALATGTAATIIRITRASVARELTQDYVTFAQSRGLSRRRITGMYMKNAAIPIITSAGLILGSLFGATILVEEAFSLPGLGQLLADSITFKDVPVVQALALLIALVIITVTFVVDLLAAVLDPTQNLGANHSRRIV